MSDLIERAETIVARHRAARKALSEHEKAMNKRTWEKTPEHEAAATEYTRSLTAYINFCDTELSDLIEAAKKAEESNPADLFFSDLYKAAGPMIFMEHKDAEYPVQAVPVSHIKSVQTQFRRKFPVREIPEEGSGWGMYRKIPVVVEAIRVTKDNIDEIIEFMGGLQVAEVKYARLPGHDRGLVEGIIIRTLNGPVRVPFGEWLIKGVKGEFYPIRDDILRETYTYVGGMAVVQ